MIAGLFMLVGSALAQDECTVNHCSKEYQDVVDTDGGLDVLTCFEACDLIDTMCPYDCGFFNTEIPTHKLLQCRADNGCYPADKPTTGIWIGTNEDAVTDIADMNLFSGDWWNVKGILRC